MRYQNSFSNAAKMTARQVGASFVRPLEPALQGQLFRYAEDLQQILEQHAALQAQCETLRSRCERLSESGQVFDALTGLPNHRLFQDRLAQKLLHASLSGLSFALIEVTLDGFRHSDGQLSLARAEDTLLREIGIRLTSALGDADTVARLDRQHFFVLATLHGGGAAALDEICSRLLAALARPVVVGQEGWITDAHLGAVECPRHADDVLLALMRAEVAAHQARAAGGNAYRIFDPAEAVPA